MNEPTIYCRYESKRVPDSEVRLDEFWGPVHEPTDHPAHTLMGSKLETNEAERTLG